MGRITAVSGTHCCSSINHNSNTPTTLVLVRRLLWDCLKDMIVIHQGIHKANKGLHVAAAVYTGSDDGRNESPASSLTLSPNPLPIPPFFIQQALITSQITHCPLCSPSTLLQPPHTLPAPPIFGQTMSSFSLLP